MKVFKTVSFNAAFLLLMSMAQAGTLENPTSYRDCQYVPKMHAIIKILNERYSACFDRNARGKGGSSRIAPSAPTTCSVRWPKVCVHHMQQKCDVRAKYARKQELCRIKMNRAVLEQRQKEAAQKEFQRKQKEQQQRAVQAEQQRRAAARRQMGQIHKYKDSAIVSSHLAARMSGLRQPPIGGSYYLSQSLSAIGTRFITNTMADSLLQLERAVYGAPRGKGVNFVHGGYSANNPRIPMSAQSQAYSMYGSLREQANRTALTSYQLPLENMSVQSAMVSGILSLIVQSQLDGESPDLQSALTNVIAFGVSSILDDDVKGPSIDDRRRNMFGLLEADKKRQAAEQLRNKSYNYCLKTKSVAHSGNQQKIRGTNACKLTLNCSIEKFKNSQRNFVTLTPGKSLSRWVSNKKNGKHQYWYGCIYPN